MRRCKRSTQGQFFLVCLQYPYGAFCCRRSIVFWAFFRPRVQERVRRLVAERSVAERSSGRADHPCHPTWAVLELPGPGFFFPIERSKTLKQK